MHILCTICSDLVNQAENIYVTKCGHVFHYSCLSQWIVRSKSCPQCRNKVTDKCMFRLYPTISNENTGDDVTTLQSRLDDAQLQLRQQKVTTKEKDDKIALISADLKKNEELLKACEKKLVSRESAVSALKEQLEYVKIQNRETQKLKEENESLRKNIQTLNGLQKVLNATSDEVEQMLEGYSDVRTIATFATALKRALCESESKKNESRDRLQSLKQQLFNEKSNVSDLQAKLSLAEERLSIAERKYDSLKNKRKASDVLDRSLTEDSFESVMKKQRPSDQGILNVAILATDSNSSFNTMVKSIEDADSPYLNLKQSSLALAALQRHPSHPLPDINMKPSEFAMLNSARNTVLKKSSENTPVNNQNSIFYRKQPPKIEFSEENDLNISQFNVSYDGLGGHSKLETFPKPCTRPPLKSCVPKLTAKHKLKRPNPTGSRDISKMLEKIQNK
ncbi:E3 ubiquitin-protein ligase TRAIP-like [Epargyreus clarus]|uniref:E3 ubiquitin-protein ligase TRAIP-like n=1 Tax=Epargyreus clarus TaxID=520877 RepID=UPI003C2F3790